MASSNNYTLGEILKVARFSKKLSISKMEVETKIRGSYISALEEGDYLSLPADIYVRGILKNYSEFLGLDYSELLKLYRREGFTQGVTDERKKYYLDIKSFAAKFMITHKLISGLIFLFFLSIISFFIYQNIEELQRPPKLTVTSPIDNMDVSVLSIDIIGNTDRGSTVLIDGQKIFLRDDGTFIEKYTLEQGENNISIQSISDYNSKKTLIQRKVFYNPKVNISIEIEALDNTFMKIEADGIVVFEKSLDKGTKEKIQAKDKIKITTHNGKNTVVYLGEERIVLSDQEELVEREFTPSIEGVVNGSND